MKLNTILALQKLPVVDRITDLGIAYNNRPKFSPHVDNIVSKASLRAKLILRCFQSRDPVLLTKAFSVFVPPLLEFSSVVWNPVLKQDITRLESVQRKFTKRLSGLRNFSYTTRLSYLGLDSLQCRRIKADLSMCYKIINNYICTQVVSLCTFRLPNKPGVILENYTNLVSHLFVTVIPSPNALSLCGILSLSVL